jgi:DNA-binding response OmpR family regulator
MNYIENREKPLVMLVDDDEMLLQLGKSHLERAGFDVILCRGGGEAISQAQAQHPDIAVVDVLMPEPNGWEVSRMLKQQPETADIPIFLLTALADEKDIAQHRQAAADGYFVKPFRMEILIKRLREALEKRQAA